MGAAGELTTEYFTESRSRQHLRWWSTGKECPTLEQPDMICDLVGKRQIVHRHKDEPPTERTCSEDPRDAARLCGIKVRKGFVEHEQSTRTVLD